MLHCNGCTRRETVGLTVPVHIAVVHYTHVHVAAVGVAGVAFVYLI